MEALWRSFIAHGDWLLSRLNWRITGRHYWEFVPFRRILVKWRMSSDKTTTRVGSARARLISSCRRCILDIWTFLFFVSAWIDHLYALVMRILDDILYPFLNQCTHTVVNESAENSVKKNSSPWNSRVDYGAGELRKEVARPSDDPSRLITVDIALRSNNPV